MVNETNKNYNNIKGYYNEELAKKLFLTEEQQNVKNLLGNLKTMYRLRIIEEIDEIVFNEQIKYETLLNDGELLREGAGGLSACITMRKAINKLRQDEINIGINL